MVNAAVAWRCAAGSAAHVLGRGMYGGAAGSRRKAPPQRWTGGAAEERESQAGGRGARGERRFTEPDDTSPGGAAGSPAGPRAAVGRGSRGRLRGCQCAPPGCAIVGRFLG